MRIFYIGQGSVMYCDIPIRLGKSLRLFDGYVCKSLKEYFKIEAQGLDHELCVKQLGSLVTLN